jgi:hypothetical protein
MSHSSDFDTDSTGSLVEEPEWSHPYFTRAQFLAAEATIYCRWRFFNGTQYKPFLLVLKSPLFTAEIVR